MNVKKLVMHTDAGHGWLEVPFSEVLRAGIASAVSRCSYVKGDTVFLEEDCDAPRYLRMLESFGEPFEISESYIESSPIRNYTRYEYGF